MVAVIRGEGGQSVIEFALVVGSFLTLLFGALSVGLFAVQRSAAVTAAAAGARAAGSAGAGSPGDPNLPDLAAAGPIVSSQLSPVLFGSALTVKPAGVPCDSLQSIAVGQLQVCSTVAPDGPSMVLVVVRGKPTNLFPALFSPWTIDAEAEFHRVTFAR